MVDIWKKFTNPLPGERPHGFPPRGPDKRLIVRNCFYFTPLVPAGTIQAVPNLCPQEKSPPSLKRVVGCSSGYLLSHDMNVEIPGLRLKKPRKKGSSGEIEL